MLRRFLCALLALILVVCLIPLNTITAKAASAMKASEDILQYLKVLEGFSPIPHWDYHQWTVGYGTRCPDEDLERYLEEGIPIDEAEALFMAEMADVEAKVNAFIDKYDLTFTQNQFDAVLSVTYNCGSAWLNSDNDLRRAVLEGTTGNAFVGTLTQRCTAGGEYLPGLMRRRITEAEIYLNGNYSTKIPDNYAYVFYDAGEGKATAVAQGYDCNLQAVPMVTASRDGYTFLGWYTAETGGVKVNYLDENLNQTTLYAHWQAGEGEYSGNTTPVPDGIQVTVTGDVVNVRSGPGTNYSIVDSVVRGEQILITQVAVGQDGRTWGKFDQGWLCLTYTTYEGVTGGGSGGTDEEEETYEVPVCVTIVKEGGVTVYNGPHQEYPKIGTLQENEEVLIVEVYLMIATWWGRLENGGWICLNRHVMLHNDQMLAHSATVTVTNSYLNIRSGPGADNDWVGSLREGNMVEVLAVEMVDDVVWGRISEGWISLQYTTFDASKLDYYRYHEYGDWYTVTESTCVSHGTQQRDCLHCDHHENQQAPLSGHSCQEWYVIEEGNCVTPDRERRDCKYCDYYELREADLSGHGFGQWQTVTEPTCTESGLAVRYCQFCEASEEQALEPAGHSFGEWYDTVAPTLTEGGQQRRDCRNCDHFETRETDPVDHIFGDWYTVTDATCTEDGLRRRDCTDCDHYETEVIPALGHSFSEWAEDAEVTCTTDGQKSRECLHCGLVQTEVIAATGHNFGAWQTVTAPTCTADGSQQRECAACGAAETETLAALGHAFGEWNTEREATCAQEGLQHRDCSRCDFSESRALEQGEHSFCDWYISIEPTYEVPGQERRDCVLCGAVETREKEFNGEVVVRWYATITCSALNVRTGPGTGYSWVKCVYYGGVYEVFEQTTVGSNVWARIEAGWICVTGNASLEEVTEVVGHSHEFGDWYTVEEATADANGLERRDCACGHYETRQTTLEPETVTKIYGTLTNHHYLRIRAGAGVSYAEVGRLMQGERVEILEIKQVGSVEWGRIDRGWVQLTGYITLEYVEEPVEPSEHTHSFGDWYVVTAATCTSDGQKRRDCECGHYETEAIAATGHSFGDWYTVTEATEEADGQERRDCACGHYETRVTTYQAETVTKIYATLTGSDYLNIRSGPSGTYSRVGQLTRGDRVEILEIVDYGVDQWGRFEQGWIMLTGYMTLEYVEESTGHTHSFGDWYTVTEATESENGLERRDCACGHYETRETEWQTETVTKIYGTLVGYDYLNIRAGVGTGYEIVGRLSQGDRVEILEIVQHGQNQWGRIDRGWIQLTGYITLEEVEEPVSQENNTNTMTVTANMLNVRAGAGTNYSIVGSLTYGTEVTVLEIKNIDGQLWARIEQGWVSMTYLK